MKYSIYVILAVTVHSISSAYVPLYRLYKPATGNHFYTTSLVEANNAANNDHFYTRAGQCGASLPLYRYLRGSDHFYTTDLNEGFQKIIAVGGTYEGITCYIWAPQ